MWWAVEPELVKLAADEARFENVTTLGVDEHVWHHVDPRTRGPNELTGMVDLTRDSTGKTRARLLGVVPGRSGTAYATWLNQRGETFRGNVQVAALDPFAGDKTAIDDQLGDAVAELDAFHVVGLGTAAVDEVRRKVQQETLGLRRAHRRLALRDPDHPPRRHREPHRPATGQADRSDRGRPCPR